MAGQLLRAPLIITHSSPFAPRLQTAQSILRPFAARSFHSSPRSFLPRRDVPPSRPTARHISISSIWKPGQPTLSPFKIWRINKLEEDADAFPTDPIRQVALFQGLADADLKACYQRIIRRWERMCEFSPTNPTLRNDEAFRLYVLALVKTDQSQSVASATRRRETILAKHPLPDAPTPVEPVEGPSKSDKIAASVLEDPKAHAKLNPIPEPLTGPVSPAAAAASTTASASPASGVQALLAAGGAGGKDAPIFVTIAQRACMPVVTARS